MNREEKRQLVCQLYKDGKTMREISKEVHMSFTDIGAAIKSMDEKLRPHKKSIICSDSSFNALQKGENSSRSGNINEL
jgi:hypothetical protein